MTVQLPDCALEEVVSIMLVIFSGLPGVVKSTLAKALAVELSAFYLRIDEIEQALILSGVEPIEGKGYEVAYALAKSNLALGNTVVCDSVNPWELTREAYRQCAIQLGKRYIDIEVSCSDESEHRRRIETREPEILGHVLPTWLEVMSRDYQLWVRDRVQIDTSALGSAELINQIMLQLHQNEAGLQRLNGQ